MKRILLMSAVALAASSVMADEIVDQTAEVSADAFKGFYAGVGIGGSFLKNDVDGRFFNDSVSVKDTNVNRPVGNIFIGYNATNNGKFYLGAELLLEFTGNKTKDVRFDGDDNIADGNRPQIKNSGITPELTIKAGYSYCQNLFYAKLGFAAPKSEFLVRNNGKTVFSYTDHTIVPVIYVGAARSFGSHLSANIEAGYQFAQEQEFHINGEPVKLERKFNKGWKIRIGAAYTF